MITKQEIRQVQASNMVDHNVYEFFQDISEHDARHLLRHINEYDLGGHINHKMIKPYIIRWAILDEYIRCGIPSMIRDAYQEHFHQQLEVSQADHVLHSGVV